MTDIHDWKYWCDFMHPVLKALGYGVVVDKKNFLAFRHPIGGSFQITYSKDKDVICFQNHLLKNVNVEYLYFSTSKMRGEIGQLMKLNTKTREVFFDNTDLALQWLISHAYEQQPIILEMKEGPTHWEQMGFVNTGHQNDAVKGVDWTSASTSDACCVCKTNARCCVILPCEHMPICIKCCVELKERVCPYCNCAIDRVLANNSTAQEYIDKNEK